MAGTEHSLGELELEILKVVWEEQPCPVNRVATVMADRAGYARTTVLTVMRRLTAKGFLTRRKRDGVFHYSTAKRKGRVLDGLIRQFVETVLDGSPTPFVTYLAESSRLSRDQVRTLLAIARTLDEQRGEESP